MIIKVSLRAIKDYDDILNKISEKITTCYAYETNDDGELYCIYTDDLLEGYTGEILNLFYDIIGMDDLISINLRYI